VKEASKAVAKRAKRLKILPGEIPIQRREKSYGKPG
jgi:hypothetical protein